MPLRLLLSQKEVFNSINDLRDNPNRKSDALNYDHLRTISQLGHHLMMRARLAAQEAVSYRGFCVGAAGLFYRPDDTSRFSGYEIITGFNIKPRPNSETSCAEKMAIEKAEQEKFEFMVVMAIAGISQEDQESGLNPPTLHSCGKCRRLFVQSPLVENHSIIITVHREEYIYEVHTVGQILRMHCGQ